MRDKFPGYLPRSREQISKIWKNATFVFDSSTILNLYRYSDTTRDEFIATLSAIRSRIWIPHQVAFEILRNRPKVISDQEAEYRAAINRINELKTPFNKERGHPFLTQAIQKRLESALDEAKDELEQSQQNVIRRLSNDEILRSIVEIFDGCIDPDLSEEDFERICAEGAQRFAEKIPPGYEDAKKSEAPTTKSDRQRVYGDLIIWNETIKFSSKTNLPIIFTTDDLKKDWWQTANGKTIGPRPELVQEFFNRTGNSIAIYKPDQFLKYAKKTINTNISEDSISEVKFDEKYRIKFFEENKRFENSLHEFDNELDSIIHRNKVNYKNSLDNSPRNEPDRMLEPAQIIEQINILRNEETRIFSSLNSLNDRIHSSLDHEKDNLLQMRRAYRRKIRDIRNEIEILFGKLNSMTW
tara:strand:- start:366 stop:1601 length:1236 start_codon:yes stop_codon:yes gene_type:complete